MTRGYLALTLKNRRHAEVLYRASKRTAALYPLPDSNRHFRKKADRQAVNALPYFASPSGISVPLQILTFRGRTPTGVFPSLRGFVNIYHRTSLYAKGIFGVNAGTRTRFFSATRRRFSR